ncbi:hypothetical protein N7517_007207 [Penicillium concentricum]|uniref:Life-span regulatory factor domain-containing protein n=1 Tax=Penicillium concentricum TaxID=293559 RepID=A0A9W9SAR5_9EURO|nr:uncharacterized protein N7517_007207 [Penicillium concentricum]KAJ5375201.1 hypothetical protein N7517_007207 [Penicillium concentricum]
MTQTAPFHRRSPSTPHVSKSKSIRPALHRRGTSGANIAKLGSGQRGASKPSTSSDDTEFDMASFLNFCAMCENQITVPNNTLLYCSESCRRKDSCKPLSASLPSMSSMSSTTTPPTSPPLSPRTIVAPMTPTRVPSNSIPTMRILSHVHDAKSDLDPTEWKPVLARSASSLASSDAWNYLSQFHRGTGEPMLSRPAVQRSSSSLPALAGGAGYSNVPGLTNTPSTVASSFSSTASDYLGSMYESRPLPPRHNPYFSGTSVSKGVELVVPHIVSANEDLGTIGVSDSGSIFPASSAVWEHSSYEKRSAPICMARGIGGRPAETCVKN